MDGRTPAQQRRTQRQRARAQFLFFLRRLFPGRRGRLFGLRLRKRRCQRRPQARRSNRRNNGPRGEERSWRRRCRRRFGRFRRLVGMVVVPVPVVGRVTLRTAVRIPHGKAGGADDGRHVILARIIAAEALCPYLVNRAGVRHLLGNAEFVELVDDLPRLYFQLPRQLIYSDLAHVQEVVYLPTPWYREPAPRQ